MEDLLALQRRSPVLPREEINARPPPALVLLLTSCDALLLPPLTACSTLPSVPSTGRGGAAGSSRRATGSASRMEHANYPLRWSVSIGQRPTAHVVGIMPLGIRRGLASLASFAYGQVSLHAAGVHKLVCPKRKVLCKK